MGSTVPATAEWALWAKAPGDARYQMLDGSPDPDGQINYEGVLNRYMPGTLESLPQVTISWRRGQGNEGYLALAVHDSGPSAPAGGRETMRISYFFLPFGDVAAGAVGYADMLEVLSTIDLAAGQAADPG